MINWNWPYLVAAILAGAMAFSCGGEGGDELTTSDATSSEASASPTARATAGVEIPGVPSVDGTVQTAASGLQYIDVEEGSGGSPGAGYKVQVLYTGYSVDGEVIVTSGDTPITHDFIGFSPDTQEGLSTMKVGGRRRLLNVTDYNAATTIWDFELVSIQKCDDVDLDPHCHGSAQ